MVVVVVMMMVVGMIINLPQAQFQVDHNQVLNQETFSKASQTKTYADIENFLPLG